MLSAESRRNKYSVSLAECIHHGVQRTNRVSMESSGGDDWPDGG